MKNKGESKKNNMSEGLNIKWGSTFERKEFFEQLRASLSLLFWISIMVPALVFFLLIHVLVGIDMSGPYWSSPRGLVGVGLMLTIVVAALYRMILTMKASDFPLFVRWKIDGMEGLPVDAVKLRAAGFGIIALLIILSSGFELSVGKATFTATITALVILILVEKSLMFGLARRLKAARVACAHWSECVSLYVKYIDDPLISETTWMSHDKKIYNTYNLDKTNG
jgi:hypothetical protein